MRTNRPLIYVLAILLIIAPFFGGLYLWDSQLAFLLVSSLVLCIFLWLQNKQRRVHLLKPLDYAVFGLTVLYLISTVWAVAPRQAFQVGLKQVLYTEIFWLVSRSLLTDQDRLLWVKILAAACVFIAVASVVLAAGWIPYSGAVVDNRIAGPFQYPNALASLLLFALGLLIALRGRANSLTERLVAGSGLFFILSVFIFTYSRIAWLIAPIVVIIVILLFPRIRRLDAALGFAIAFLSTGLVFVPVDNALRNANLTALPQWLLLGLVVSLCLEGMNYLIRDHRKVQGGVLGFLGIGAVIAAGITLPRASSLLHRLTSISTGDTSSLMRYWTYRDALHAWVSISPILGLGGNGWYTVFRAYRSAVYTSRLVHSSLLETTTELGVLGGLLLMAVWLLSLRSAWRGRKSAVTAESATTWAGILAGLVGLIAHTLLDFDLWYGAFSMFLFAALAFCRSSEPVYADHPRPIDGSSKWLTQGATVASALVAFLSGWLLYAMSLHALGVSSAVKGNYDQAETALRRAAVMVPFDAAYRASLGDFLAQYGKISGRPALMQEGGQHLKSSLGLDRFNPEYHLLYADYLEKSGRDREAFNELVQVTAIDPFTISTYQQALAQGTSLSVKAFSTKSPDARLILQQVGSLLNQLDSTRQRQPSGIPSDWLLQTDDPMIQVYRGAYLALTGKSTESLKLLQPLTRTDDITVAKEALLWTTAVYRTSGNAAAAQRSEMQAKLLDDTITARLPEVVQAVTAASANR